MCFCPFRWKFCSCEITMYTCNGKIRESLQSWTELLTWYIIGIKSLNKDYSHRNFSKTSQTQHRFQLECQKNFPKFITHTIILRSQSYFKHGFSLSRIETQKWKCRPLISQSVTSVTSVMVSQIRNFIFILNYIVFNTIKNKQKILFQTFWVYLTK